MNIIFKLVSTLLFKVPLAVFEISFITPWRTLKKEYFYELNNSTKLSTDRYDTSVYNRYEKYHKM